MSKLDYCKYVDVFYGNGETDRFFEDGIASKWFYIKALCGNTYPHATLPFGKMSVGAYSGAYPTGYGTHYPNSCGGIEKLGEHQTVRGFSHLHQSGTGAIRYYYNYAVVSPFYGELREAFRYRMIENENAHPGYYSAQLNGILCELTVDGGVAYHRYNYQHQGGRLAIDFSNNGLNKIFGKDFYSYVNGGEIKIISGSEASFSGEFSGIKLYFHVKLFAKNVKCTVFEENCEIASGRLKTKESSENFGVVFDFESDEILLKVSYSTRSPECAVDELCLSSLGFDEASEKAYQIWNTALSVLDIRTDDEVLKTKFYSNLYHSLLKPCDMSGENILGVEGEIVTDFATLWDQYKTALPLIFMCYPKQARLVAMTIQNISRTMKKIPCSFGLSDIFPCEEQAKMLGVLSLCDAYYMGVDTATPSAIEECIKTELEREDYREFLSTGKFNRYTHILDVTDACLCAAQIIDNPDLRYRLLTLAENWVNAYSEDGLMSADSPYYEGDRYTYSFRLQKNMAERVTLSGGKERFARLLDSFFGFGKESVRQMTHIRAHADISKANYHRFEGFNNECDMETPYAYIYADRHERLCEIIKECVDRSFGIGKSALPGNNDSGGLSSFFVWSVLGIFPVSGSGEFLIGSPQLDSANITLSSGKTLQITVNGHSGGECFAVDRIKLNGTLIDNYRIPMQDLMQGGRLEFYIKNNIQGENNG